MYFVLLLKIFCAATGVLSSSISSPCKLSDVPCLETIVNDLIPILFAESPEHGIESSDPLFIKEIEKDLSMFKFKFSNSTVGGYTNCVVSNLKISEDFTKAQADFNCPKITMSGKYDMSGQLIGIPAEGNGDYTFITGKYLIHVETEIKRIDGNDGKTHLAFKNFKLKPDPLEPIKFDLSNLFNGQKDLADAFIKFANENWRVIADVVQEPVWYACWKKLFSNVNKRLKMLKLEDYVAM